MGMSKTGTTSIQDSLNMSGLRCIKFHSDFTLLRVFHNPSINAECLVKHAKNVFVPYRNPINRKVSQYYFYGKSKDKSVAQQIDEIRSYCLGDYSLFSRGSQTEVDENKFFTGLEEATRIDILKYDFVKENGFGTISEHNISLVPFTIENINRLASFLRIYLTPNFKLTTSRVSDRSPERQQVRKSLKFSDAELDTIFNSRYCKYFYSDQQIEEFKLWEKG
jgi:hypothetical protein